MTTKIYKDYPHRGKVDFSFSKETSTKEKRRRCMTHYAFWILSLYWLHENPSDFQAEKLR
jgi:hypothetical protein